MKRNPVKELQDQGILVAFKYIKSPSIYTLINEEDDPEVKKKALRARKKVGVVLAFREDGEMKAGWSVCSPKESHFNREKGMQIAIYRARGLSQELAEKRKFNNIPAVYFLGFRDAIIDGMHQMEKVVLEREVRT